MPMPKKADRTIPTMVYLPTSVLGKVKLELFSEIEGKVPHGTLSELFTTLAREWLRARGIEP